VKERTTWECCARAGGGGGLTESLVRTTFPSQTPTATSFRGVAQVPHVEVCRLSRSDEEEMGGQGMEEELRMGLHEYTRRRIMLLAP
jgi:hypothetical protein